MSHLDTVPPKEKNVWTTGPLGIPGGAFPLFDIFGIQIKIDYSWFVILGLVVWTLSAGYYPATYPQQPSVVYWLMGGVSALLLFASILAHELSHSLVALRQRIKIHSITLFIFGGVAQMEGEPADPPAEFKIAAAGPLCSFGLAAFARTGVRLNAIAARRRSPAFPAPGSVRF